MRINSERRGFIRARALERCRHFVTIDTISDPKSHRHPSSEGQWHLARILSAMKIGPENQLWQCPVSLIRDQHG